MRSGRAHSSPSRLLFSSIFGCEHLDTEINFPLLKWLLWHMKMIFVIKIDRIGTWQRVGLSVNSTCAFPQPVSKSCTIVSIKLSAHKNDWQLFEMESVEVEVIKLKSSVWFNPLLLHFLLCHYYHLRIVIYLVQMFSMDIYAYASFIFTCQSIKLSRQYNLSYFTRIGGPKRVETCLNCTFWSHWSAFKMCRLIYFVPLWKQYGV